jgi:hypothetical protein
VTILQDRSRASSPALSLEYASTDYSDDDEPREAEEPSVEAYDEPELPPH